MNVNIVVTGHVDHGKSTLIGRLLYDSESIKEGRVQEIQKLAEEYKKRFEFAYFLDAFDDEVKEERTIDTTGVMFKGKRNLYTLTDVPGHKEFIKNMLTGASHADIAVLVVSAPEGVQEQTRRHAFLLKMLGVKRLFVAVNRMDTTGYAVEAFQHIRAELLPLLTSFGYQDMPFIPVSAMEGDNVYKRSTRMEWYTGQTLIEAMDDIEVVREAKPPRFVVQDVYRVGIEEVAVGRVESGTFSAGDDVVFQPSGVRGRLQKIMVFRGEIPEGRAGDSVGLVTDARVQRGDVCGLAEQPPVARSTFLGEAVLLDKNLAGGEELEMKCGTRRVKCRVRELREKIDSETGQVLAKNPAGIDENEAALILFETEPMVVEKFADIPELGRFVLVRGKNIGAGIVLEAAG